MKRSTMNQIHRIARWLKRRKHLKQYTYGWIINSDGSRRNRARMNINNGGVEFILWKAGEQGHKRNWWYRMGDGWELKFKV